MSPAIEAATVVAATASPLVIVAAGQAVCRRYSAARDRGMAELNNRRAGRTGASTGGC